MVLLLWSSPVVVNIGRPSGQNQVWPIDRLRIKLKEKAYANVTEACLRPAATTGRRERLLRPAPALESGIGAKEPLFSLFGTSWPVCVSNCLPSLAKIGWRRFECKKSYRLIHRQDLLGLTAQPT